MRTKPKRSNKTDLAKKLKAYNTCKDEFLKSNGSLKGFDPTNEASRQELFRIIKQDAWSKILT